jgi:hypothetical protein
VIARPSSAVTSSTSRGDDDDESRSGGSDGNWAEVPNARPLDLLGSSKDTSGVVKRRLHIREPCLSTRYRFGIRNPHR